MHHPVSARSRAQTCCATSILCSTPQTARRRRDFVALVKSPRRLFRQFRLSRRRLLRCTWPARIFCHRHSTRKLEGRNRTIVDQAATSAAADSQPSGDGIDADQHRAIGCRQARRVGRCGVRHRRTDFFCGVGFCAGRAIWPQNLTLTPPKMARSSLAQLTLTPSKVPHAVMPIKRGLLEFATQQTRMEWALLRVAIAWRQ